jgi:hypothetical protein
MRRERAYDVVFQQRTSARMMADCTSDQLDVVRTILHAMDMPPTAAKCFFLYACGGCGKTLLLELLLAHVRGLGSRATCEDASHSDHVCKTHSVISDHFFSSILEKYLLHRFVSFSIWGNSFLQAV